MVKIFNSDCVNLVLKFLGAFTLSLTLLLSVDLLAEEPTFVPVAWQPTAQHPLYIVPQFPGETAEESVRLYIQAMKSESKLANYLDTSLLDDEKWQITPFESIEKPLAVMMVNDLGDNMPEVSYWRDQLNKVIKKLKGQKHYSSYPMKSFKKTFAKSGASVFALPLAVVYGRSEEQRDAFARWVAENVDLLVSMGGDDISPALYDEENTHSDDPEIIRDNEESYIIKSFVDRGRGFMLGVCRGDQLTSTVLGQTLVQDINTEIDTSINHKFGVHRIRLLNTSRNLLRRFTGKTGEFMWVNSLHHQAVDYKISEKLELAAVAKDGVVEALEFKNGRGILVQFHPEQFFPFGIQRLLRGIVEYVNETRNETAKASTACASLCGLEVK